MLFVKQPDSDAVLLRRAYAAKQANDASWQRMASELRGRFAAIKRKSTSLQKEASREVGTGLFLTSVATFPKCACLLTATPS